MDCVNLAHISNPSLVYKVNIYAEKKSNILSKNKLNIIKSGDTSALIFVIKYLNFYESEVEMCAPEFPLIENIDLKDLFEQETFIFEELLISDNKEMLYNVVKIADELNMEILLKKLAAIFAHNMQAF